MPLSGLAVSIKVIRIILAKTIVCQEQNIFLLDSEISSLSQDWKISPFYSCSDPRITCSLFLMCSCFRSKSFALFSFSFAQAMFLEVVTGGSQPLLTKWVQVLLESGWGAPNTSESVCAEYDPSFDFHSLRWLSQGKGSRNRTDSPDIWILPRPSIVLTPQLRCTSGMTKNIQNDTFSSDARENRICK